MKPLLLTLSLFLNLQGFAQSSDYKVTGWHYESGITSMQVQFNDSWCVFQLVGNHIGDVNTMIQQGCIPVKRIALYHYYPVPGLGYVKAGDEEKIKQALGVKVLCNGDVDKINASGY